MSIGERNKKASKVVRRVIAEHLNRNYKEAEEWKDYLYYSGSNFKWIEETFKVTLTQEDYEKTWKLFKHQEWFRNNGYYIRGWLAVAEALGIGEKARKILEETSYPHADKYEGVIKCPRPEDCPICKNREYLESLGELKPEVTDNKITDEALAMNFNYYSSQPIWVRNWLVLRAAFIVKHTPKCPKCGELNRTGVIFGCDSWVRRIEKGICYDCDPEWQRQMRRFELEMRKGKKMSAADDRHQKTLENFLKS